MVASEIEGPDCLRLCIRLEQNKTKNEKAMRRKIMVVGRCGIFNSCKVTLE
jgi:hypothetical protein